MDPIPVIALLLSLASAVLFFVVGHTIQRRHVSRDARSAQLAFVTWWYGIGAVSVAGAIMALPWFPLDLELVLAMTGIFLLVICVALGGLIHYLVFLYTSRRNLLPYIIVGYTLFFALLVVYIAQSGPNGIESTRWGPELQYESMVNSGPLYWTVLLLMLGPPILSAGAYLSLYRLTEDPVLKRRILLVSLSIIVWFGSSLIGVAPGAQDADWYRLGSRLVALGAAAVVLYAYTGLRPASPQDDLPAGSASEPFVYEPPKPRVSSTQRIEA